LRTQFGQRRLADEIAAGPLGARHPRAAVLAERRHHFDLIQRQRAFRIVDETLAGRPRRAALWISIARICPVVCGLRPANPLLAISRVGLHIDLFEACSAFTRVAACTLARSPIVAAIRRLQPFRYLHDRVGLAPTGKRRLVTAHAVSGHPRARDRTTRPKNCCIIDAICRGEGSESMVP